ncbi:MAG: hypothetical protein JW818_12475 [Pirellulales bacterium]|nr:hypothetical protein [Pirellulales bacterium]
MSRSWIATVIALVGLALIAGGSVLAQFQPPPPDSFADGAVMPSGTVPDMPLQLSAAGVSPSMAVRKPGKPTAEERILAALSEEAKFEFMESPLEEIAAFLAKHYKISVLLDKKALEDLGIAPDHLISCRLQDLKLRSALNHMLRDLGLTYVILDEALLITSVDQARCPPMLRTEIYDVTDLAGPVAPPWAGPGAATTEPKSLDALIELVQIHVSPDSWKGSGCGEGEISSGTVGPAQVLIVTQDFQAHFKIQELLTKLRRTAATAKALQQGPGGFGSPHGMPGMGPMGPGGMGGGLGMPDPAMGCPGMAPGMGPMGMDRSGTPRAAGMGIGPEMGPMGMRVPGMPGPGVEGMGPGMPGGLMPPPEELRSRSDKAVKSKKNRGKKAKKPAKSEPTETDPFGMSSGSNPF